MTAKVLQTGISSSQNLFPLTRARPNEDGSGSVRFSYGLCMEQFERVWLSVLTFLLAKTPIFSLPCSFLDLLAFSAFKEFLAFLSVWGFFAFGGFSLRLLENAKNRGLFKGGG